MALCKSVIQAIFLLVESGGNSSCSSNFVTVPKVQKVVAKGNKALGFIRRNVGSCPEEVKKQAYLALVRPHLEYASSAWNPYLQKHIQQIEMVQRRAARVIKSNYSRDRSYISTYEA
jgi:hypothetical protein